MKKESKLKPQIRARLGRVPLLVLGMVSLAAGIWGGLIRLPMNLPLVVDHANWITYHGPLMVCGFLGTLIGLERAVGLGKIWAYAAPLLTGAGAILFIVGQLGQPPVVLILAGSAVFAVVTLLVVWMQPVAFTGVMSVGAWMWVTGNLLWALAWPFNRVVPWWIAFLALTIVGERLDLSRFQKPSRWSKPLLWLALGVFLAGTILSGLAQVAGERLAGLGLLALAGWLVRFDIARRTVRQAGLPRFMAACLLVGYFWLAVSGLLMLCYSPLETGLAYDAVLHSFFLGFIFSMIFGHAPIIFPAVLQVPVSFRRSFYGPLALLHGGLILRVTADAAEWAEGRQWGAVLNGVAILLFLLNTIGSMVWPARPSAPGTDLQR